MNRTELYIQAIADMGCCFYTTIDVPEQYSMNQVVSEVRRLGYKAFRIVETGMRFVYLSELEK